MGRQSAEKQHFRLRDGWCLEDENYSVAAYPVRVEQGVVQLQPCGTVAAGHGVLAG